MKNKKLKSNKGIIKKIVISVVVLILIAIGVHAVKQAKKKDQNYQTAASYAIVVSTQKAVTQEVSLTLPYLALVQNDKDVLLSTKIPARLLSVKKSGSQVRRGDVIARLDNTGIQSNINSVKAQLDAIETSIDNMNKTHERTQKLLKVEGASIEQSQKEENVLARLQSQKEVLTQKLTELNNMLTYTVITAPVSGTLSKTMLNAGDMAMPGHPIAKIQAKHGFYLLLRLPPSLHASAVIINGKRWKVTSLNSMFNGLAEYKVYADLPGARSGDRMEISVEVYHDKGIKLPFDAILNREGKSFVLVRDGDHATAKRVTIAASGEEGVVVVDNSLNGKEIVVEKQDILLKLLTGVSISVKGELL